MDDDDKNEFGHNNDVDYYYCNVGNAEEIKSTLNSIYSEYQYIDLVCCNAGISEEDDGLASSEHWKKVLNINVLQHTNLVRNCITNMLLRKNGFVLN